MRNSPAPLLLVLLSLCLVPLAAEARQKARAGDQRGYDVTVRRTTFGIPHVRAKDFGSLGYGSGYAFAEDNVCVLARTVLKVRGEQAEFFGDDFVDADLFWRYWASDAQAVAFEAAQSEALRSIVEGYSAGLNRFITERGDEAAEECRGAAWLRPISVQDLYKVYIGLLGLAGGNNFEGDLAYVPPEPQVMANAPAPRLDPAALEAVLAPMQAEIGGLGSNAVAVGKQFSDGRRGQLLVNPHFPWRGELRFWQLHVTIPGVIDSMGAAIFGSPVPNIAFNKHVAWSHTVSAASRFVLRFLELDPTDPTAYLLDGEPRAMTPVTVAAKVLQDDGSLETVERTFYESEWGPLVEVGPLGWLPNFAVALEDVNRDNFRIFDQYLAMSRSKSVKGLRRALGRFVGLPWVNTVAADHRGRTLYADIGAVPHLTDEKFADCSIVIFSQLARGFGAFLVSGARSECALGTDPDAPAPGIFGASNLPAIQRFDYVQNSNDSYWIANPAEPLEGFAEILGGERETQGLRTRLGNIQVEELTAGGRKIDGGDMEQLVQANRNLSAELALEAVLEVCIAEAPVSPGCSALTGWDGTQNTAATGAVVWRELWPRLRGAAGLWAVPFDVDDPVHTPREVDLGNPAVVAAILDALAGAEARLETAGLAPDLAWGDAQFREVDGERIPIPGGPGSHGVYNAIGTRFRSGEGYTPITSGSSIVEVVRFTAKGVEARGVLTYSQSTDPESPHFADQTRLFSEEGWN
ncbi:MAG: penicillin acylase family protein, partial [Myxococcales bacterium]|nr:penicillin acylase family protein [Myxococcales bacterium]